ncbi:Probable 2-oxoglutarate-dependent dioxygenase AOP1.2 [Linum perenne]
MGCGQTSPCTLPIIDFSDIHMKAPSSDRTTSGVWKSVSSRVLQAVQEYGCFQARYRDISEELRTEIDLASEEAFSQPLQAKQRNVSDKPFHGYIQSSQVLPLYESLGIDDPENPDCFTKAIWPYGNPKFSETVGLFSRKLAELERTIRRMILEGLGVEKYVEEQLNSTCYQLRLTRYKEPHTTEEKKVGLKAHIDQNTCTILHQNHVDGLEFQTKDGAWNTIQFSPHCFLVLIGESFNAWTNGRLKCAYHRVMMRGDKARLSAGLFSIPKQGFLVKAPKELVDEEHPLLFRPYDYIDYLRLRSKEIGKPMESPLKAYFGV